MKHLYFLISFALLLFCSGCNDQQPLTGKVTFDDGSPVTVGTVVFSSDKVQSFGVIKPDGTYSVSTSQTNDGLPPGTYTVYLSGVDDIQKKKVVGGDGSESEEDVRTSLIDPKFTSSTTSGLTFTVDGKTKTFDIKVDRAK